MNPAAPVTRTRIDASLVVLLAVPLLALVLPVLLRRGRRREALLHRAEGAVDLGPGGFQRLRTLEVRQRVRAAVELQQRVAEVVVGEALGRVAGPGAAQSSHRAREQPKGVRVRSEERRV